MAATTINERAEQNKQIKKKLIDLEMNQKTFASMIGIAPAQLNDILSGRQSGKKYREQMQQILSKEEQRKKGKKTN